MLAGFKHYSHDFFAEISIPRFTDNKIIQFPFSYLFLIHRHERYHTSKIDDQIAFWSLSLLHQHFSIRGITSILPEWKKESHAACFFVTLMWLCGTGDPTWSFGTRWGVGADAVTRLQRGGRPRHDGVVAAHWQSVWKTKYLNKLLFQPMNRWYTEY